MVMENEFVVTLRAACESRGIRGSDLDTAIAAYLANPHGPRSSDEGRVAPIAAAVENLMKAGLSRKDILDEALAATLQLAGGAG